MKKLLEELKPIAASLSTEFYFLQWAVTALSIFFFSCLLLNFTIMLASVVRPEVSGLVFTRKIFRRVGVG